MKKIKKAKNCFLHDITNKKFFDLSNIDNIIGYSNKKLTHSVKNGISAAWNIEKNSIYHQRFESFIKKEFGKDYIPLFFNSIRELFLYLKLIFEKEYSIIVENNFKTLLESYNIIFDKNHNDNNKTSINIIDCAYDLLMEKIPLENGYIAKNNTVLNYYYYPSTTFVVDNSIFAILPKIFSGNFNYIAVIIKSDSPFFDKLKDISCDIPSLYLLSSLKNIFVIRQQEKLNIGRIPILKSDKILQKGRLFLFNCENIELEKLHNYLYEKNILINTKPPYYNYLPLCLNEHQKRYIENIFLDKCGVHQEWSVES